MANRLTPVYLFNNRFDVTSTYPRTEKLITGDYVLFKTIQF